MNRIMVTPLLLVLLWAQDASQSLPSPSPIQVYFSPKGGCTAAVVRELNAARSSVLIQTYAARDEAMRAGKKPCHECNP